MKSSDMNIMQPAGGGLVGRRGGLDCQHFSFTHNDCCHQNRFQSLKISAVLRKPSLTQSTAAGHKWLHN
uniref:Uncharacterized protein n=1 Tax=Anguilla anguilla TaxID=7936 RepID=A0A0E9X7I7_ANGAN